MDNGVSLQEQFLAAICRACLNIFIYFAMFPAVAPQEAGGRGVELDGVSQFIVRHEALWLETPMCLM